MMGERKGKKWTLAAGALLCCLLWGITFPVMKINYAQVHVSSIFDMLQLAGFRFTVAGIMVLIYARTVGKTPVRPKKAELAPIAVVGLLQTFGYYALYYIGIGNTTASKTAVMGSAEIFFCMVFAFIFLKEDKPTLRKIAGLVLGVVGLVGVNFGAQQFTFTLMGEGFLLIACVFISIAFIYMKKKTGSIDTLRVNGWQLILGGVLLLCFAFSGSPRLLPYTAASVGVLFGLSAISAVAFSVWYLLLRHNQPSEVALYKFAIPIFGAVFSALILPNEPITVSIVLSLLFVAGGIVAVNLPSGKKI